MDEQKTTMPVAADTKALATFLVGNERGLERIAGSATDHIKAIFALVEELTPEEIFRRVSFSPHAAEIMEVLPHAFGKYGRDIRPTMDALRNLHSNGIFTQTECLKFAETYWGLVVTQSISNRDHRIAWMTIKRGAFSEPKYLGISRNIAEDLLRDLYEKMVQRKIIEKIVFLDTQSFATDMKLPGLDLLLALRPDYQCMITSDGGPFCLLAGDYRFDEPSEMVLAIAEYFALKERNKRLKKKENRKKKAKAADAQNSTVIAQQQGGATASHYPMISK